MEPERNLIVQELGAGGGWQKELVMASTSLTTEILPGKETSVFELDWLT